MLKSGLHFYIIKTYQERYATNKSEIKVEYKVYETEQGTVIAVGETCWKIGRFSNDEDREQAIKSHLTSIAKQHAMNEKYKLYETEEFKQQFNEQLETAILATRHGGSGAKACRDTLLSLYNGNKYKVSLSSWYNLDSTNRAALLFVLEHQTANNRQDIDLYLPQYQCDFERMKKEWEDAQES